DNLSTRIGGSLEASYALLPSGLTLRVGGELFDRRVRNILSPQDPDRFPATSLDLTALEQAAYAELESAALGGQLRVGARIDAFNGESALQPRISFARPLTDRVAMSVGAGRA